MGVTVQSLHVCPHADVCYKRYLQTVPAQLSEWLMTSNSELGQPLALCWRESQVCPAHRLGCCWAVLGLPGKGQQDVGRLNSTGLVGIQCPARCHHKRCPFMHTCSVCGLGYPAISSPRICPRQQRWCPLPKRGSPPRAQLELGQLPTIYGRSF